jgi:hypothetical protein
VVVCLPLDPRITGSDLAEGCGFLRAIKIHWMTFSGGEVMLSVPYHSSVARKRTSRA